VRTGGPPVLYIYYHHPSRFLLPLDLKVYIEEKSLPFRTTSYITLCFHKSDEEEKSEEL